MAYPSLPKKYQKMIEEVSDEGEVVIFYVIKWVRDDGAHQIPYEPGYHTWNEVLEDFARLKPCNCEECRKSAKA